jgi:hypothetical protein
VPGSATAPGPGRLAVPSTSPLLVDAMQNTEASVTGLETFVNSVPAVAPVSLIVRQAVLPKQPAWPAC